MVMHIVGQPERLKRKNIIVNTNHCRQELDTIQYVVKKFGYRESREQGDGNLFWYGIALRDNDIEFLKNKVCMINRYPLMDVSILFNNICSTLLKRTFFVLSFQGFRGFTQKISGSCLIVSYFLMSYRILKCI